ncbi:epididymal secretory protein 4-like [Eublepharis macularius]|uniref:Epididymal secretory protein 4-like n=1 Tax=Eublepharis macularius TaxID=481883 RepID=A0AA97KE32_EUBMA|nr:epididymal secretory protein 4-like [Eublepharis macularius]
MKSALLITVLASICLLSNAADIPVYPNFNVQKLAGTWYRIADVVKGKERTNTKPIDDVVEPSEEGDMVLRMRYIQDGKCKVTPVHLSHTDKPGIFTIPASNEIVHMVDVRYESYHIVHVEQNGTYSLYLLSRKRKVANNVRRKFKTLAKTLGFDVNHIINVRLADSCPK